MNILQFINSVCGSDETLVSDGPLRCTREVKAFAYKRPDGIKVILVDTPGFGDGKEEDFKTDEEIFKMIAEFPGTLGRGGFSGVILLQSISGETQKPGSVKMIQRLCGSETMENVVVVTTRWDEFCCDTERAADPEQRLVESDQLWHDLHGARVPFFRTGFFGDKALPKDHRYQRPRAVVESLLGLEIVPGRELILYVSFLQLRLFKFLETDPRSVDAVSWEKLEPESLHS
ncbi:hypothetical protein EST38_g7336 [Candolleomyces aberdarensis]|uniref:AIG1-type G domain-containing protein n=1 Tax=Candolleomyces aberdarensis TaxID=2316362 RepID=A0A4Q2DIA0_9AGAR|nr:hypothetical protein EST38_g7336 [Candolleomyces aberdarensis]